MQTLVKVDGYNSLLKDTKNGGVVNVDKKTYEHHMLSKISAKQRLQEHNATKESMASLQQEVESLKGDISSIKDMLIQLIEKSK